MQDICCISLYRHSCSPALARAETKPLDTIWSFAIVETLKSRVKHLSHRSDKTARKAAFAVHRCPSFLLAQRVSLRFISFF